ncbi:MAG: hypothetical protein PHR28_01590 [candidate division Zixibacteria bacterium]|nr:hypothetical protein [candidate division Zixibacteria bacterium]
MKYWQIMAGSASRDYSEDFLRYGIAFVGGEGNIKAIESIHQGDLIVLKRGMSEILAVGRVVDRNGKIKGNATNETERDMEWLRDYDGWDLPAYCFVDWHVPPDPEPVKGLTRATVEGVNLQVLREIADRIYNSSVPKTPEDHLPGPTEALEDHEILTHLIGLGLSPSTADMLTTTFGRVRLLASYYYTRCNWEDVREHETRTFLIVPLLLALGWSEQQMKIELGAGGKRIDIACFRRAYRRDAKNNPNNGDCALILESKGFSQGLDYAHTQGKGYATWFSSCQVVIASNGYCYKAYQRNDQGDGFSVEPSAYLNLLRPRKQYSRNPDVKGGLALLELLLPNASSSIRDLGHISCVDATAAAGGRDL